jgi:hypothetical protein
MKRRAFITLLGNFAAMRMSPFGTSRHFVATQQFGRFRSEADIDGAALTESGFMNHALRASIASSVAETIA